MMLCDKLSDTRMSITIKPALVVHVTYKDLFARVGEEEYKGNMLLAATALLPRRYYYYRAGDVAFWPRIYYGYLFYDCS